MIEILFPLLSVSTVITVVFALAFWLRDTSRPLGKVKSFKTRFTPNVWTSEQMDYTLQVFERVWLNHFPTRRTKVKRILNSLDIEWTSRRWRRDGVIAAAETMSPRRVKIWRGPKVQGDRYRMNYTALPEGLIQVIVFNLENRVLDSKTISKQYKDVIVDIKKELEGQITHGIRYPDKTDSKRN